MWLGDILFRFEIAELSGIISSNRGEASSYVPHSKIDFCLGIALCSPECAYELGVEVTAQILRYSYLSLFIRYGINSLLLEFSFFFSLSWAEQKSLQ